MARTASTAAECRAEEPLPASREEGAAKYGSYRLFDKRQKSRVPLRLINFQLRQAHAVVPAWELHAPSSTGRKLPFPSLGRTAVRRSSPRRLLRDGLEQETLGFRAVRLFLVFFYFLGLNSVTLAVYVHLY